MNGLLVGLASMIPCAQGLPEPVLARLDEGPLVVLQEDHRVPVVYMELRFPLGGQARVEPEMAHLVEHLAFRSGGELADGEFDRRLEAEGGESNGWTSHDWMALTMQFPPSALGLALDLERGRLGRLTEGLTPEILETELQVITQEWEMRLRDTTMADPQAIRLEIYPAGHAYRRPLIVDPSLTEPDLESIQAYERTSLSPEQAVLVLVGDFDIGDALSLMGAEPLHSREPGRDRGDALKSAELVMEKRRLWVETRTESVLYLAWLTPPAGHPDLAALELLGAALALGPGSVMERALWHRRSGPREVSYRLSSRERGGEFQLGIFDPKGSLERSLRRVDRELARIHAEGLRPAEIERARLWLSQQIQIQKRDLPSMANAILLEALGRESAGLDARLAALDQVNNADILRVANRWLGPERLILAVLPQDETGRAPRDSLPASFP
jgi:zinc protease